VDGAGTGPLTILVPGDPAQLTGGYLYNRHIARGLEKMGQRVRLQGLEGRFPETDDEARSAAEEALSRLPDGSRVIVDGLALGGLPELVSRHRHRLRILALVHHPLADETGLAPARADQLRDSETRALEAVRGVITTSTFTARRLADFEVPVNRIRVVEPGVEAAPEAAGSGTEPRLLCVASVLPRKGQDLLLEALGQLRDKPWCCELVGSTERDPAYAEKVWGLIERLGLSGRVRLCGEQSAQALGEFYHRADLFVLPSHYEGYGMVVTEALARGLPVLTTTGGALRFTLPDQAGVKVPPGDVEALTDALRTILSDPGRLQAMRRGARAVRQELRDWHQAAAEFGAAVDELAGSWGHASNA
jgi:glycosyltransferase involved in cell wall biosynthesis